MTSVNTLLGPSSSEEAEEQVNEVATQLAEWLRDNKVGKGQGVLALLALVQMAACSVPEDPLFRFATLQAISETLSNICEDFLSGNSTRPH